ncbi:MAG: hypothetical protein IJJ33_02890, partial [Victivallales bacterium]|nr:hypothetical protein [Victivallales bacterium]
MTFFTESIEHCSEKLECIDGGNSARQFFLAKKSETTFHISQKLECYGCGGMSTLSCFRAIEAPMNRRLYSRTKRTFFMEMENKSRFFLNMGDGSKKTLIPTCYFGKNTE